MDWSVIFGVALGVGLGLGLFTCLFVLVVWAFDKLSTLRQDRDTQTQQRQALQEALREGTTLRANAQARDRTIRNLRAELARFRPLKPKPTLKVVPKPRSSWERIVED